MRPQQEKALASAIDKYEQAARHRARAEGIGLFAEAELSHALELELRGHEMARAAFSMRWWEGWL